MPIRYNRQVEGTVEKAVLDRPSATSRSFGGIQAQAAAQEARDLFQFGNAIQQTSQTVGNLALLKRDSDRKKDKSVAHSAFNNYRSEMQRYRDEVAKTTEGQQALNIADDSRAVYEEARQKYKDSLETDDQKELFDASARDVEYRDITNITGYQEKQRKSYENAQLEVSVQNAKEDAVALRDDPRAVAVSEAELKADVGARYADYSPEMREKMIENSVSDMHKGILQAELAVSAKTAKNYLKDNWKKFNPIEREQMKEKIDGMAKVEEGVDYATELHQTGMTIDDQKTKILQIKDKETRDSALKEAETLDAQKKSVDKEREQAYIEGLTDEIVKNHNTPIPADKLSFKGYKDVLAFKQRLQKGGSSANSWTMEGKTEYLRLTDPDLPTSELQNADISGLANKLPLAKYMELRNMKAGIKGGTTVMNAKTYANRASKEVVPQEKSKKGKAAMESKRLDYMNQFQERLNAYTPAERNNPKTWEKVQDELTMDVTFKDDFHLFGIGKGEPLWKAEYEGREGIRPVNAPESVANIDPNVKWVEFSQNGQTIKGWEGTFRGEKVYFVQEGGDYRIKRIRNTEKVAGK